MDRRTFLARLGFGTVSAAAAVCAFDVEKLLWVPGEKRLIEVVRPPVSIPTKVGLTAREYHIQLTRLMMAYPKAHAQTIMQHEAYIIDSPTTLIAVS